MSLFGLFTDGRENPGVNTKKPYNVDSAGYDAAGKTYGDAVRQNSFFRNNLSPDDPTIRSLAMRQGVTPEFYIQHIEDYNK